MAQTSPELELFVREALLRGQSRDAIRQADRAPALRPPTISGLRIRMAFSTAR